MLEVVHTILLYKADNGHIVEVRQGNATGKLVTTMVTTDSTPGQILDAALVAARLERDARKDDVVAKKASQRSAKAVATLLSLDEWSDQP